VFFFFFLGPSLQTTDGISFCSCFTGSYNTHSSAPGSFFSRSF